MSVGDPEVSKRETDAPGQDLQVSEFLTDNHAEMCSTDLTDETHVHVWLVLKMKATL